MCCILLLVQKGISSRLLLIVLTPHWHENVDACFVSAQSVVDSVLHSTDYLTHDAYRYFESIIFYFERESILICINIMITLKVGLK